METPAKHRRSIRLPSWDYASVGAYFVTICAWQKELLFSDEALAQVALNCWEALPHHFPHVALGAFVVMPNHVHGVLWITRGDFAERGAVGARHASPLRTPDGRTSGSRPGTLGAIVGSFKSAATKRINELRGMPGAPVWQRNYYERVVRDDDELNRVRAYIAFNPAKWDLDRENASRIVDSAFEREWDWLEPVNPERAAVEAS